ncbi:hypothetical protein JNW90_28145 [Micromonospora sp. STR1s_5]|nr:hypothetical protein [Micromonospora sp. STR1s_5]
MAEGLDARLVRAQVRYEQAVFGGDAKSLDEAERDLTALDADVALARGRLLHARFLGARVGGRGGASALRTGGRAVPGVGRRSW